MAIISDVATISIKRPRGSFEIPIIQATPNGVFSDDPADTVIFGQGIGEIGRSQQEVIARLADLLGSRVVGYESRLGLQVSDPINDAVEVARSTHFRVVDEITNGRYRFFGHSMAGLTAGALLGDNQGQVSHMVLSAPATVTSEVTVSKEWREMMYEMTLEERVANFKDFEKHWRRHAVALALGFGVVNVTTETIRGATNPIRSMRSGMDIVADIWPILKHPFDAFALLANVSTVPELKKAQEYGTFVEVIAGVKDPVFKEDKLQAALDSAVPLHLIKSGRGQGHSALSTLSGEAQLEVAAGLFNKKS